jgi:hypothetical protein
MIILRGGMFWKVFLWLDEAMKKYPNATLATKQIEQDLYLNPQQDYNKFIIAGDVWNQSML